MDIILNQTPLHLLLRVTEEGDVRLLHIGLSPFQPETVANFQLPAFRLVEVQVAGMDQDDHHGLKHTGTLPGKLLRYDSHSLEEAADSVLLRVSQQDGEVKVISFLRLYREFPGLRSWTEVENESGKALTLTYVSSFALTGLCKESQQPWDEKCYVHIPGNSWGGEAQWRRNSARNLGMTRVEGISQVKDPQSMQNFSMKRINLTANGTWGCGEYLPMGCVENEQTSVFLLWQIEHHASWQAEISDTLGQLYLRLSGPTDNENQWVKTLAPGERFESVCCGLVWGSSFEETVQAMTRLRRVIRRPHWDNEQLPVIFNDYMNCLYGDPTTEKLLPLIDAAAQVGCEVFCIDAGWYADGAWWDGVGEWQPSAARFPGGIQEPISYIHSKGMIPGLWLELEVMGVRCPLANQWPEECFFQNHGRRVVDHGRYQLDFRHPRVTGHADEVLRRLVEDWGVGYIKMDYNINAGVGTTVDSDSVGDGLLRHARAYVDWLHGVMERYPRLIIENCSSGGMRMAYSLLRLHSIQSTSDQIDFRKYAAIASAAATAVTPEQSAVWAYPTLPDDDEATIFNMVNALLFRIHQSGHLAKLTPKKRELVREGIALYKILRKEIPGGLPFYPTGLPHMEDGLLSYGMRQADGRTAYIAVWRAGSAADRITLALEEGARVQCVYPKSMECHITREGEGLTIELPSSYCARLLRVEYSKNR